MGKGRLEAFSDGVLAIIITIMVLEIHVPHTSDVASLKPLIPVLIGYVLSFLNIAIYWNNHHHILHTIKRINGKVMWANTHLLFWLSLVPAATGWMGETHFAQWPVVIYGFVFIMAGIAYNILISTFRNLQDEHSPLVQALGDNRKGYVSALLNFLGIGLSFVNPMLGFGVYVLVAALWIVPNKRIEKILEQETAYHPAQR